jgi:hypothetical protein
MWFDSSHQPSMSDAPGPLFTRALFSMRLIWLTVYQLVKSQLWKLSELARAQITCRPEAIAEVSGEVQRHADPVGDGYVIQGLGVSRPTPISVLMDCDQPEASNYKPVTARSSSHLRYTCGASDRPMSFTVRENTSEWNKGLTRRPEPQWPTNRPKVHNFCVTQSGRARSTSISAPPQKAKKCAVARAGSLDGLKLATPRDDHRILMMAAVIELSPRSLGLI